MMILFFQYLCATELSAMERELRLMPKMSGTACSRDSRGGKSFKTATIHSARFSNAWMVANFGVLLLVQPDRLTTSMANGAVKSKEESENTKWWKLLVLPLKAR